MVTDANQRTVIDRNRPVRHTWAWRYTQNRESVLGRRFTVSVDPELAAEQMAEHLGGHGPALRWAAELVAALERRRAS